MTRWAIGLAAAGIAMAAGGYWIMSRESGASAVSAASAIGAGLSGSPAASQAENARLLSADQSLAHRSRQYQSFERVEQAHELPSTFARREALHAIAAGADEKRVRELIVQAESLASESDRVAALEILVLRLAELDPAAALQRALETDPTNVARLIAALSARAPEQTWKAVAKVDDPLARMDYQAAVATTWATKEPQQAFASVTGLPSSWMREQLLRHVTWNIARRNPQLAVELVRTIDDDPDANTLLAAVADQWSRYDPSAAARWIESEGSAMRQGQLAYRIANAYIEQRPEEALAWALRISRSPGRNLWSHMVGQMAMQNPYEALRLAEAAENPTQRTQALGEVLTTIAARDPALATSQLQKLPAGDARTQIAAQVALQIARTRPASAIDWLDRFEDRQMRIEVANQIAAVLADNDPDAAAQLVDRIPEEARSTWIASVANAYARSDLDKGMQWVARYKDEPGHVIYQFARTVAARSPDVALNVIERMADDKEGEKMLSGMLPMIAMQSPETAARAVGRISDQNARAGAAGQIAQVWSRYDEPAARRWVQSLESGPVRDSGLSSLVANMESLDERLSLIGQIQSPDQRMNTVMNAAMRMASTDPESARTLLRRYPLDPQRQQQLDNALKQYTRDW